ncbi:MAG TPA: tRNA (adenosine(37)-N6)-threonylcarbamoyltransferase complex ATPase subunit type 1 TsaE [Blastocatellia bacterium]|nr:tRNA (adenosine(37)-N6)-threonylcarbamoyltransferase complex ATPase subunit type 1 TsaE [Blastocatellia bacterium]
MRADSSSEPETTNQKLEASSGEIITNSPEETFAFARSLGERLTGGEVFLLKGDLGAGKTVFAKGLAAGLGIASSEVTSPSFTIINEYTGRLRLYHIDLYRLDDGLHDELGLAEILEDRQAVVVIEWAERLGFVPEQATLVELSWLSENQRIIAMS